MGLTEKREEDRQAEQHEYKLGGSDVSPGSPQVPIGEEARSGLGKEEEDSRVRSEVTLLTTGRKGMISGRRASQ